MPIGISGYNNVTYQNISSLTNFSGDPIQFALLSNQIIFGGAFYFILLILLGVILFIISNRAKDQVLVNLMFVCAGLSILGFFLRTVQASLMGMNLALINDFQMWVFPLLTVIFAGINWFSKQ